MLPLIQALKNKKEIKESEWEIRQIAEKTRDMYRMHISPLQFISPFYGYVFEQVIMQNKTLADCSLSITKKVYDYDRYSRPSYEDFHIGEFHYQALTIEFGFRFKKCPNYNLVGQNAIDVTKEGFQYMQIYVNQGKEKYPLLQTEDMTLSHPLVFEKDVPWKLQLETRDAFRYIQDRYTDLRKEREKQEKMETMKRNIPNKRYKALAKYL